ncbi:MULTISPECIES: cytochrome-c peroxidase [Chitinophagaceae]
MHISNINKVLLGIGCFLVIVSWITKPGASASLRNTDNDSVRALYERPVTQWPRPHIDSGVQWQELSALQKDSSYKLWYDNDTVKLGKLLFFDPRLSRSNQISCSSCHDPDLAWQDGRKVSLGNDHLQGTRNTPSLFNVFIQKELFWDGRRPSLYSQAAQPLAQHHEMDMEVAQLPHKLNKIKGYSELFKKIYGDKKIKLEHITDAIAAFERTITSRKSNFDKFAEGDYKALNDEEIEGLHLFRTKARCMNCHNGTYFTDLKYHNIGLTYYKREYEDLGRYNVTKRAEDVGKFKTATLRNLMLTRPWMHNGLFDNLNGVINMYNSGMHQLDNKNTNPADSLYPHTDVLLQPLQLTKEEKKSLVAFLEALTTVEYKMPRPELPK